MIYLPNKIFYYFAAGLAVLNTITGQCSQIIREGNSALAYKAGNVDSCAKTIEQIVGSKQSLKVMQQNSCYLAESRFDRKLLYTEYIGLIERLFNETGTTTLLDPILLLEYL